MTLYGLGVVCAAALTLGIATRAASVASWLFLLSLHHRNAFVCNGGDSVLRLLLFWGMFTDWGARLSLDVRLGRRAPADAVPALPVRFVQLQVAFIYLVTAAAKRGVTWRDGSAIGRVLASGDWARGLGGWLGAHPALCVALSHAVLVIEWSLPVLLLAPWRADRVRAVALAAGLALHVGIFATLRVGMFSEVMPVSYLVFVRPRWLDALADACARRGHVRLARGLGRVPAAEAARSMRWSERLRAAAALATAALVATDFSWRVLGGDAHERPRALAIATGALAQDQRWEMFAPDVPRVAISWTAPAELANGRRIDLTETLLPKLAAHHGFVYSRWHKLREVLAMGRPPLARAVGRYVCRLARATLPSPVVRFELVQHVRSLDPPAPDVTSVHLAQPCE
jgi:hypothetical protein